jgi:16S rRNA (uracil1498-N3)-methyltransferase
MNRFFVTPDQIRDGEAVLSRKEDLHHLRNVLRLRPGDKIALSDSVRYEYVGEISALEPGEARIRLLEGPTVFPREPEVRVTLFQGVPKQGKLEVILQKSVELGAAAVVPVFTARTVVADRGNWDKKSLRYRTVAAEAAAQSGRGILPEVGDPVGFDRLPGLLESFEAVAFLYENEADYNLKDFLKNLTKKPRSLALVVGPEGGFAPEEAARLSEAGFRPVSLGRTILRTETAGPAALAMVMYELEL